MDAGSRPTSEVSINPSSHVRTVSSSHITNATSIARTALKVMALSVGKSVAENPKRPAPILTTAPETRTRVVRAQTSMSMATSRSGHITSALVEKATGLLPLSASVSALKAPLMPAGWAAVNLLITESPATPSAPETKRSLLLASAATKSAPMEAKVSGPSALVLAQPTRPAVSAFFACQKATNALTFGTMCLQECSELLMLA